MAQLAQKEIQKYEGANASGERYRVSNILGHSRREVVEFETGKPGIVTAPSCGVAVQEPVTEVEHPVSLTEENGLFIIENEFIRAKIGRCGKVASLIHKATSRDTIASSTAGQLALYEDKPLFWDAWDLDVFHLEKRSSLPVAALAKVMEQNALRVTVRFEYSFSKSKWQQDIRLDALSPYMEFINRVDWQEKSKILMVEYDVNVRASEATYEIQFGSVKRPTHYNTSWDIARFEVCQHRWFDFSEYGFGGSMLNDCKYGANVHGNRMALSLLRSSNDPDPVADRGEHEFRYALVQQMALDFNRPLKFEKTSGPAGAESYFGTNAAGMIIDTVKKAEDNNAVIIRLFEAYGGTAEFVLTTTLPFKKATLVNLMEDEVSGLTLQDGQIALTAKPFQILTVKLE